MRPKLFLFSILLLITLLATACHGAKISITVVIPTQLVPYYEWLLNFPGWVIPQEQKEFPHPIPIQTGYKSVTHL